MTIDIPQMRERLIDLLPSEYEDHSIDDPDVQMFQRAERGNRFQAADIHTVPPRGRGDVPKTEISIPDVQSTQKREKELNDINTADSGINVLTTTSRSSNSGGEQELVSQC